MTPASTFKIPLAVMGFDSGFLTDDRTPVLSYKAGDVDWGGENWRRPTDPTRWLKYSVVWYSQRITHALGTKRIGTYLRDFGFGNADVSGDPGKHDGLDRAWIASSLKVSPREQANFLRRLLLRELPASAHAMRRTEDIVEISTAPDGWRLHGKTGTAYPRVENGVSDQARGYGWYVGWAERGNCIFVFARLARDAHVDPVPTGLRTRSALLAGWPAMMRTATLRQHEGPFRQTGPAPRLRCRTPVSGD